MRIAYVCYWNAARRDGVVEKIASQLSLWRGFGHEVELFLLTPLLAEEAEPALGGRLFPFRSGAGRVRQTRSLYAAVAAFAPSLVYLRYDLFAPPPLPLVRLAPTAIEVNSDWPAELEARSRPAWLYERLQDLLVGGRIAGAVCVTHELAASFARRHPRVATAVVANGIDLDGVAAALAAPTGPGRLVYLGDDVPWQGVDRILELAAGAADWEFDLVGIEPLRSRANVRCHGFLTPEQYTPILARAHLAIGSLALYRKAMREACALKVRRYLAMGLPVVLGHEDTDFLGLDPWFLLRLPNRRWSVAEELPRIRSFLERTRGRRVPRDEVAHLDAGHKEELRLAFLSSLVRSD